MQISIVDPILQTVIVGSLLLTAILLSARRHAAGSLGTETTLEIKGFAILAIVLAHVGYYLARDHQFLFPLSVLAGVGVDLFLFASGFGLTASALARPLSPLAFYRRRLGKIYIPLWITLAALLLADFFALGMTYPRAEILSAFFGWFPEANLYANIDSPLWYISFLLFYYLAFPLVFSRRYPALSALVLGALGYSALWWAPAPARAMLPLYELHILAFPLGMIAAHLARGRKAVGEIRDTRLYAAAMAALLLAVSYFAIHSEVGKGTWVEQGMNLFVLALILAFFLLKRFKVGLFRLFGAYSFEVYLLHWPILYRYGAFFGYLPAWAALGLYLASFIGLGWMLQALTARLSPGRG